MNLTRRRRSKAEIWTHILAICARSPRTQTAILSKIGLNTDTVKDALAFLLTNDLLHQIKDGEHENGTYLTTPRGEEALAMYYRLLNEYFHEKT